MEYTSKKTIDRLYRPNKFSHKGQNGKLLIIGGSSLFHGASLWALKTASRIVDMVFYLSTDKNQQYADWLNKQLYDFISIPFEELDNYMQEAEAVLLGPGMVRINNKDKIINNNDNVELIIDKKNFEKTYQTTKYLLQKYPQKKWILDAGALQVMEAEWLKKLTNTIITPHIREFCQLFKIINNNEKIIMINKNVKWWQEITEKKAKEYGCTIVLKGPTDIICNPKQCVLNKTGNEGMTKGGTGDVLAGLVAALACKNDLFTAAAAGTYICGLAGDELYAKVGTFYNASDLCDQIPRTLHEAIK